VLDAMNPEALGAELHAGVRELYPICRSITGDGLRASLRILGRTVPLTLHEVPSGTRVFDWVVPREWNLRGARLLGPGGEVIADAARLNLHVLNYSVPFRGQVSLEELQAHLHSLPEAPELVPYRTSYYREAWGFCLSHAVRSRLGPGEYQVEIDTTLSDGSLTYGELVLPGAEQREVLVSTHCCHPSLANDNCAGMVMCAELARILSGMKRRYTYRFLFIPGTIGAITWLALNEEAAGRIAHGLVAACVGDGGRLTYKRSRRADSIWPSARSPERPTASIPSTTPPQTTPPWSSRRSWSTPCAGTWRSSRCWKATPSTGTSSPNVSRSWASGGSTDPWADRATRQRPRWRCSGFSTSPMGPGPSSTSPSAPD